MILCFKRFYYSIFYAIYNYYRKPSFADVSRNSVLKVWNIHRKTPVLKSLFGKEPWKLVILLKKNTPTQMFSCEYCKVFKKILFKEHHRWLLLYFKFIGNLMTYVNRDIDDMYFQHHTLCLYRVFLFFFFAISFAEVIITRQTNCFAIAIFPESLEYPSHHFLLPC